MPVFIVRCTASATIGEAWRVTAPDETGAINAVIDGNGEAIELLRDWTIGDEEGRANFEAVPEADEVDIDLIPTPANENNRALAEVPAMVAALRNLIPLAVEAITERACSDDPADLELLPEYRRDLKEARAILARIDGAGDTLPDAPAPVAECSHCGRDNTGHEGEPCADDCPQYWEAKGLVHPEHPTASARDDLPALLSDMSGFLAGFDGCEFNGEAVESLQARIAAVRGEV